MAGNAVGDFATQFNAHDPRPETLEYVWRRLLTSIPTDVRKTSHSKPFVLAVLYMLHVERFSSERPRGDNGLAGEVKAKRREIIKRYDVWIPCSCRKKCLNEWNFASDQGIYRSASRNVSKCNIAQLVEDYKDYSSFFGLSQSRQARDMKTWKALLDEWKSTQR